jgi:hypothetical protein
MRSLQTQVGSDLRWIRQRKPRVHFELNSGDDTLATLTRLKGSRFVGEAAEGRWSFTRAGCVNRRVTVRSADADREIGALSTRWTGCGMLELAGGARFFWKMASFWKQEYAFRDDHGLDLVRARSTAFGKVRLSLDPAARGLAELPILALLATYVTLLTAEEAAVSAAVSVATFSGG